MVSNWKIALAGQRRRLGPHGEAVADRHAADLRPIDLVDQPHVGENRRVTHVVDSLALLAAMTRPQQAAEIDRTPVD